MNPLDNPSYLLPPLLAAALSMGLCIMVARHGWKQTIHQSFAVFLLAVAAWSFFIYMMRSSDDVTEALYWEEVFIPIMLAASTAFHYFTRAYTNRNRGWKATGISLVFLALILILGANRSLVEEMTLESYGFAPSFSVYFYPMAAAAYLFMLHGIWNLVKAYQGSKVYDERVRLKFIMIGTIFPLWGTVLDIFPSTYPTSIIGNLIFGVVTTIAIQRYRLLDVKVVIRRGLIYSASSIILGAAYLLLLFGLQLTFLGWDNKSTPMVAILLAVALSMLFTPIRNMTEQQVERLLFRDLYRYRKLMLDFSNQMANVLDLERLVKLTLETTKTAMQANWVGMMFADQSSGDYRLEFSLGKLPEYDTADLRLRKDEPVLKWFAENKRGTRVDALDVLPTVRGVRVGEMEMLRKFQVDAVCPIVYGGTLSAILVIGVKENKMPYAEEQIDLLMTVANGVSVVIENARIMDSLRKQQMRAESLLEQVVAAQEEERQRIATELHDGLAQSIVGISYQAQFASSLLANGNKAELEVELKSIEDTLNDNIKEIRRVLNGLLPPDIQHLGLLSAMRKQLERLDKEMGNCGWEFTGRPVKLPYNVEATVYRIVQEGLNNARSHSNATSIWLKTQFLDDELIVEIRDNGKGFDVSRTLENSLSTGHLGLWGMKQRAQAIGGSVEFNSVQGIGTKIEIKIPTESLVKAMVN